MNPDELIKIFNLEELPHEGGYFRRMYQCKQTVNLERGLRNCGDSIYYLITEDQFSGLHKLLCDEMWHFYAGDPIEQLVFNESELKEYELGNRDFTLHMPQALVPANYWQATKLKAGGKWALVGTNAFPAYAQEDFMMGNPADFIKMHKSHESRILKYVQS